MVSYILWIVIPYFQSICCSHCSSSRALILSLGLKDHSQVTYWKDLEMFKSFMDSVSCFNFEYKSPIWISISPRIKVLLIFDYISLFIWSKFLRFFPPFTLIRLLSICSHCGFWFPQEILKDIISAVIENRLWWILKDIISAVVLSVPF